MGREDRGPWRQVHRTDLSLQSFSDRTEKGVLRRRRVDHGRTDIVFVLYLHIPLWNPRSTGNLLTESLRHHVTLVNLSEIFTGTSRYEAGSFNLRKFCEGPIKTPRRFNSPLLDLGKEFEFVQSLGYLLHKFGSPDPGSGS